MVGVGKGASWTKNPSPRVVKISTLQHWEHPIVTYYTINPTNNTLSNRQIHTQTHRDAFRISHKTNRHSEPSILCNKGFVLSVSIHKIGVVFTVICVHKERGVSRIKCMQLFQRSENLKLDVRGKSN